MSLRLIKPGASVALRHPKTGAIIEPLYVRKNGTAVWPVLGAGSDDPDDPGFTGSGGSGREEDDDDDDDDEDEGEDDDKSKSRKSKSKSKSKDDDDDEDDDEDDDDEDEKDSRIARASRQAKNYRLKLREAEKANADMAARLKAIEDKDKKPEEIQSRDIAEAKAKADKAAAQLRATKLENAFLKANSINWVDPTDAFKLIDLEDVEVDEDGTVDERQLARALRALAKRKPHLVKPVKSSKDSDDEDDDEQDQRSGRQMNGKRRGSKDQAKTREELAKRFPVLGRM